MRPSPTLSPCLRSARSYSAGYPCQPLQLKLRDPEGLLPDDVTALAASINDSAAAFAKQEAICVFNLVDECQEFLRSRNAEAARRAEEAEAAATAEREGEVGAPTRRAGAGAAGGHVRSCGAGRGWGARMARSCSCGAGFKP